MHTRVRSYSWGGGPYSYSAGGLGSGQMDPVEAVDGVVPVPGVGADDVAMDLGLAGASAALSGAGGAGRKAIASRLARQRKWAKKREHKASP